MSERVCVRGCTQEGVHFATCAWYGIADDLVPTVAALPNAPAVCKGCAPVKAKDGALICARCDRRLRRFIADAPDLVGRLRSLIDPSSAMEIGRSRTSSGRSEPPALAPVDLLDASEDVMRTLRTWAVYVDPRSGIIGGMPAGAGPVAAYEYARECASIILGELDRIANNRNDILALSELVLEVHRPDDLGERVRWSIVDAVSRYRLERPDTAELLVVDDDTRDGVLMRSGVREWGDRLIPRREAVTRAQVGDSTFRRWVADEVLAATATTYGPMGRVTWFRTSEVDAAVATMAGRRGRPRNKQVDTRSV